jgi:transposase
MHDCELYATLLGVSDPWDVVDVDVSKKSQTVSVAVAYRSDRATRCPVCGDAAPRYDSRQRKWRHLDTMQYRTEIVAEVPRVNCSKDGIHQIDVPWAEKNSRFTALFERLVINWLLEASIKAVAQELRLSWAEVDGIQSRAVRRGLDRRRHEPIDELGVDETSFQKRHEYVTVCCDIGRRRVLHVSDDRKSDSLSKFFESLTSTEKQRIKVVATDMWDPYLAAIREHIPHALVVFDKFHIAKHLGTAVDYVRKQEHRELVAYGDYRLSRTKYMWLQRPENMSRTRWREFAELRHSSLRSARAWAMKETAMALWHYRDPKIAEARWRRLLGWLQRSRLEPMKRVGRTLRNYFQGVLNAVVLGVTNALAEGMNSRIQWIKRMACGFRNRERFKNAIYFHLGGLDLYPSTH